MTVGIAIRERILHLCEERGLSVNKFSHDQRGYAIDSKQYHQREKQQRHGSDSQEAMRWIGHHSARILLYAGIRRAGAGDQLDGVVNK